MLLLCVALPAPRFVSFSGPGSALVTIPPGDQIQKHVDGNPPGTIFELAAGTFVMQSVVPKSGNVFKGTLGPHGERQTTLTGAKLLTAFVRRKASNGRAYWAAEKQTHRGQVHGECQPAYPRCNRPEDLFFNDVPLVHAASLDDVEPTTYFFDYDQQTIYLFDDPEGHKVELSVVPSAFSGSSSSDVTIQDLIVEKYAAPTQFGAIGGQYPGPAWIIKNNEVRLNHGLGIRVGSRGQVLDNYVHSNGQMGMGGSGDDILVQGNEIAFNRNYIGVDCRWECGGFKYALTHQLTVRGNYSHHNVGPGMWTDIDNVNSLYEENTVSDNEGPGIFHEISYKAIIRNNIIRRNGKSLEHGSGWLWDAQIQISTSQNVEIYGNIIDVDSTISSHGIALSQQSRGHGQYGEYKVASNYVHHNDITVRGSGGFGVSGGVADYNPPGMFGRGSGNQFDYNRYHVPDPSRKYWSWNGSDLTFSGFQREGHEINGSVDTNGSPPASSGPPRKR